jgi:hypothetical protein
MIADGAALPSTVLTLSHWPASPTPPALAEDTSARIAFRYLDSVRHWPAPEAVSNDHFDQDGLVSVYALVSPDEARVRRAVLEEVATAGDFATFADRDAARASFALAALADPERSPLAADLFAAPYPERCAGLYEELLGRLPELVDNVEAHRALWEEEDAALTAAEGAAHPHRPRSPVRARLPLRVVGEVRVPPPPAKGRSRSVGRAAPERGARWSALVL